MAEALLRLPAVIARTGCSRPTIYKAIARGDFPTPIKLGARAVAWQESQIEQWVQARISASRNDAQ